MPPSLPAPVSKFCLRVDVPGMTYRKKKRRCHVVHCGRVFLVFGVWIRTCDCEYHRHYRGCRASVHAVLWHQNEACQMFGTGLSSGSHVLTII